MSELYRINRLYHTVVNNFYLMLRAQDYSVSRDTLLGVSFNEGTDRYKLTVQKDNGEGLIICIVGATKTLNKGEIQAILDSIASELTEISDVLIFSSYNANSQALNYIKTEFLRISVNIITFDDLTFDVSKHVLCQDSRILSEDEKLEMYSQLKAEGYNFEEDEFNNVIPQCFIRDPVSRHYGGKDGDILSINRETMDENYQQIRLPDGSLKFMAVPKRVRYFRRVGTPFAKMEAAEEVKLSESLKRTRRPKPKID